MKETVINTSNSIFDFLFIGLGAANCLLILRLHENNLLLGKTVGIIEPNSKKTNDRTFCFWSTEEELLNLKLKSLISYSWDCIEISGITKQEIKPLHYYHVKGIDLYNETKNILHSHNVTFISSYLTENPRIESTYFEIKLENEILYASKVFDSRPPTFLTPEINQSHLLQSFYGWVVKTKDKKFDTSKIVMMDFNVPQNNFTQFIYILPFNDNTALIELTRFGKQKLQYDESQIILNDYINKLVDSFEVLEEEQGVIPMSSAGMQIDDFGSNWVNTGVKANLLKSTTGYAFHSMAEDAITQMEAVKNDQLSIRKPRKQRFLYYDRLLLKILDEKPEYGKVIFETLFEKVPVIRVLNFMREKTNFKEEISIFAKLPLRIVIETAIKDLLIKADGSPILILPFLFTILSLVLSISNLKFITWSILALGFLTVGLSHGAIDHLTSKEITNKKQLGYFIVSYLLKGAFFGVIWIFLPDLALVTFIVYSAWHFGQADFKEWNLNQGWQSLLWGLTVLITILFFHIEEFNWIINQIPNLNFVILLKNISKSQIISVQILVIISGLFLAILNKSINIIYTLIYLLLSSFLPLLVSFGIYFVFQHSVNGWLHLSKGLNQSSYSLWLKSLPFTIGGVLIILYFMLFFGINYIGMFFIILSCLSLPHVFSMHNFYTKLKEQYNNNY